MHRQAGERRAVHAAPSGGVDVLRHAQQGDPVRGGERGQGSEEDGLGGRHFGDHLLHLQRRERVQFRRRHQEHAQPRGHRHLDLRAGAVRRDLCIENINQPKQP